MYKVSIFNFSTSKTVNRTYIRKIPHFSRDEKVYSWDGAVEGSDGEIYLERLDGRFFIMPKELKGKS